MTALSLDKLTNRVAELAGSGSGGISAHGRLQINCDIHGPYMAQITRLTRRDIASVCPECKRVAVEADEAKKAEIRRLAGIREREMHLSMAAIPARFIGRTLASFKAETQEQIKALSVANEYVANWADVSSKGRWLVFSGQPGTGKSHLAIAILQALMPAHVGRYMTCMELIQTLRATWRKDSEQSETELLEYLTDLPLLVIDEIGVQYGTESEQHHLFEVLDRRYREMQPTILLTNQDKDGFRTFVGDRVYDRMTECARWVPFVWSSYRPTARREMQDA